jgi:hypothetical protein
MINFILIEFESNRRPGLYGSMYLSYAFFHTAPIAVYPIDAVAVLIPAIDAEMNVISGIQHTVQSLPPLFSFVTAVGDDDNLYVFVLLFHPCYDLYQFPSIYGITIITTECYFFGLLDHVAEIVLEPRET